MTNGLIQTILLAMTPIGELRAAIPVAIAVYKMNWFLAYIAAVLGNLAPVIFLLLFLKPLERWLSQHFKFFARFFSWLIQHTAKKAEKLRNKRYIYPALALFVAVPLPMTGGWTGALIAFLLELPFKKALLSIALGVAIAGLIVASATLSGIALNNYLGWQTLIIIIFIVCVFFLRKLFVKAIK